MEQITLQGTYNFEPLTIQATRQTPNVVTVFILIGDPEQQPYSLSSHKDPDQKRLFAGVSFCHPNDDFDFLEGIRQACRHALQIGGWDWTPPGGARRRAIYRACRVAINLYWTKTTKEVFTSAGLHGLAKVVQSMHNTLKEYK